MYVRVCDHFLGTHNILFLALKLVNFEALLLLHMYEGVWAHGDYCLINPNTGGIWMLGRRSVQPNLVTMICIFVGDVTEPAKIRIRQMRISCAKSIGCGCGYRFVVRSKLTPAIIATEIQLGVSYLKLNSYKQSSSE